MMADPRDEKSLGELFSELAGQTTALVRQEIQLASAEMTRKARTAARHGRLIAAGGVLLHLSGIAALVGVLAALQPLLPLWVAAAIVAGVLALLSLVMMWVGAPLVGYVGRKNEAEGHFRFGMMRVRDNAESVALMNGGRYEQAILGRSYDSVVARWMAIVPRDRWTRTTDLLIFHGRKICDARRPECGRCPLFRDCRWEQRQAWALGSPGRARSRRAR